MYAIVSTLPLPPIPIVLFLTLYLPPFLCFTISSIFCTHFLSLSLDITHCQQVLKSITFQLSTLSFSFLPLCFVVVFFSTPLSFQSITMSLHLFLSCLMLSPHLHHLSNATLHSTVTFICYFIAFPAIVRLTVSALLPLQVSQCLLFS